MNKIVQKYYEVDGLWFEHKQLNAYTGEPIKRTKASHPYSYEPFITFKTGETSTGNVYSDRLLQWDYDKYNKCCEEVWGNQRQYFDNRSPESIEKFLRLYFDKPDLVLTRIIEECNVGNGYPVWSFGYKES